jgi:hypothetical protein
MLLLSLCPRSDLLLVFLLLCFLLLLVFLFLLLLSRVLFDYRAEGRFRFLCLKECSRGDGRYERMSRRSLRYKGGVTRGREDQPQVNCSIKRGSPITKMFACRVIWRQGQFDFSCYKIIYSFRPLRVNISRGSHYRNRLEVLWTFLGSIASEWQIYFRKSIHLGCAFGKDVFSRWPSKSNISWNVKVFERSPGSFPGAFRTSLEWPVAS